MKKFLFIVMLLVCTFSCFSQSVDNAFRMEQKESEAEYQIYVGKRIRFREVLDFWESDFKIKADTGIDYTITNIIVKPHKDTEVHIQFSPVTGGKAVEVVAYNKWTNNRKKACFVSSIPLTFMEEFESVKDINVGKLFDYPEDRNQYKILEMNLGNTVVRGKNTARTNYKAINVDKGNIMYFSASYVDKIVNSNLKVYHPF